MSRVSRAYKEFPQLNETSLQAIYKYDILSKVSLHEEISFAELVVKCNLYELDLHRILRFVMIYHRIFQERNANFVTHFVASRRLIDFSLAMNVLDAQFDETWQKFAHVDRNIAINVQSVKVDLI